MPDYKVQKQTQCALGSDVKTVAIWSCGLSGQRVWGFRVCARGPVRFIQGAERSTASFAVGFVVKIDGPFQPQRASEPPTPCNIHYMNLVQFLGDATYV